ncbi:hypothetical protein Dsin_024931 [Dipteronia sinensis]|uniref:Myb/SANT-like domain-containing protein n=1 Tax=Dipteronia sinensis TaxID=43782 RepID=A0AAE0DWM6_9ROSI|nr:hypothetical protein Dsin_024931 [Dipteronia sinensis]
MKGGKGLRALDETYIRVHVPKVDKPRFRTRKCEIATNVSGACSRDMLFTFVFPRWEGSTSDSRVLRDALSRLTGLKVPTDIMDETVANGGRADCGSFKAGTLKYIELRLSTILPNCSLRSTPHIESKLKTWKKQYELIYDMINTSGFGWNGVRKCVEVDSNEAWHSYVHHHKQIEVWIDKPFPLYERLANIFGKDRATEKTAYTSENLAANLEEDDNFGNEFEMPVGNFSPMSEIFKAQQDEEQKLQFVASLLSGDFDV